MTRQDQNGNYAGLTTFLSMAYVLALYPNIMSKIGLPPGVAMIAAALASALGTFLMGCQVPIRSRSGCRSDPLFSHWTAGSSDAPCGISRAFRSSADTAQAEQRPPLPAEAPPPGCPGG